MGSSGVSVSVCSGGMASGTVVDASDVVSSGVSVRSGGMVSGTIIGDSGAGTVVVSHAGGKSGTVCKVAVGVVGAAATFVPVGVGLDSAMVSCTGWARR